MTEVVVLDTGRKNEIVIRNRALARAHDAGVRVDPDHLRHEDRHVLLPSLDRADGSTFAFFVVSITPPMNFQPLLKSTSCYFRVLFIY